MRISIFLLLIILPVINVLGGTRYYRASYQDDPSTTIVIGWCDDSISTNATVYYDVVDHGDSYSLYAYSKSVDRTQVAYGLTNRFSRITGLIPNTIYYCVIHDDEGTSNGMYFKTLPSSSEEPISFISGGDSRTGGYSNDDYLLHRSRRQACDSLVAKIRPDFVAFNGDYVIYGHESYWSEWFSDWQYTLGENGHLIPIIPIMGNHEESLDVYNFFDVADTNDYFSLQVGGNLLRIYSLNTYLEDCDSTQTSWLENDLNLHTGTEIEPYWKYIHYHVPFVPHAAYSPDTTSRNCWAPLFEEYGVDVVGEAHSHILKVTWPISLSSDAASDHGFIRDDENGIVYAGEGSWGAPRRNLYTYYNESKAYSWTRNQSSQSGFQLVSLNNQKMEIRTVIAQNVIDVGQVQIFDPPCTLPANLPLWDGDIITINYKGLLNGNDNIEPYQTNELTAYPVPAKDRITVAFDTLNKESYIEIYNSLGAKICFQNIKQGSNSIALDLNNYQSGTYYLFLVTEDKVLSNKFIHIQ